MKPVKLCIDTIGGPRVNDGWIVVDGGDVVAIEIDLHSKRCTIEATSRGGRPDLPGILLRATEDSLEVNEDLRDVPTHIIFPEYDGWRVWSADVFRYTLCVCLAKNEAIDRTEEEGV